MSFSDGFPQIRVGFCGFIVAMSKTGERGDTLMARDALGRRDFLRLGGTGAAAMLLLPALSSGSCAPPFPGYGPLLDPNGDGLRLPAGFTSRIVATSNVAVAGTAHTWHLNPDGGACFAQPGGGWVYVSNSERAAPFGGVGRIEFDAAGTIIAAGSICSGTSTNCAGGATPWGTWLTGEEVSRGRILECDPTGVAPAVERSALGLFTHEAAAVDPTTGIVYLTEDRVDGGLYRFLPAEVGDLSAGVLEVLTEVEGTLAWAPVPDPAAVTTSCRYQVAGTKAFNGGEGIAYGSGMLHFTTKGDNRVWRYRPATNVLDILYDDNTSPTPILTGVDNVTIGRKGDVLVAEDGGDLQIVLITPTGRVAAVVQLVGVTGSEITGPAFSPAGDRLYFSSQRNPGTTYEVTGPFR